MFIHPLVDGPAIVQIGPISFPFYGISYFIGYICFEYLGVQRLKQHQPFTEGDFYKLDSYLAISALVGGRIGDILFYRLYDFNIQHYFSITERHMLYSNCIVLLILSLWCLYIKFFTQEAVLLHWLLFPILTLLTGNSGMSFHGAFIGGLLGLLLYSYHIKKSYLAILDFIAPLVTPTIALGRLANFINGELVGRITTVPWGVIFPRIDFAIRHPSQLYECFLEGILLFCILWNFSKQPRPNGATFGLGITLYAMARIFVEFFREPSFGLGFIAWGWLTKGQLLSLPMLAGGVILLANAYLMRAKSNYSTH